MAGIDLEPVLVDTYIWNSPAVGEPLNSLSFGRR